MQTPNSNNGNNYMSNNNRNGQQQLHSAGSNSGGSNAFSFFSASPSSSHQQFVSNNTMFSAFPWQSPHPQFYSPPMAPPPGFHQQQQQQPPQPNSSFMQQSPMLPPNNPYMLRWPWQTNYYNHQHQQQQQQFIQPWQWQTPAQAHPAAMALLSPQHQQFGMSTPVHQQQQQLLLHATAGNLLGKEYVALAHQQHPAPAHQQQMLNATATPGYPQAQEDHTLANQQPAQQQLLTGTGSIPNEIGHHNGTSGGTLAQQQPPMDMTAQAQQHQIDIYGESIGQTAGEPAQHINPRAMHSISLSAAAEKATREIAAKMAMAANGQKLAPSATGSGEVLQLQQQQQQPYLVDEPSSSVGSRCATTTATECGSSSSQLLAADGDGDGAFNSPPPMATDTVFCQRPPNPETTNAADSAADKAMSTPSTSTAAAAASVHWNARRQLDSLLTALGQQKPTKSSAKSSAMKSKTKTTMKAIKTTKTSAETAKTKAQTKTSSKTRKTSAKTTEKAKVMGRNVALKDDRIRKMVAAYADWAVENPEDKQEGLAILTEQVTAICGPYPKLRKILYGRAFTFTWNKRRKEKKQLLIDSMAPHQQSQLTPQQQSQLQQPKVAKKKLKKKRKPANKKTPVSATKKKKQTTAGRNCQLEANGITSPTQWAISSVPNGHSGSLKMRLRARREDEQQQQTAGAASTSSHAPSNSKVAATTAAEEPPAAEQKCSANLLSDDFYEGLSRVLSQIVQRPSVKTESAADDVEMKSMPMPCAGKEEEPGSSLQQFAATMLPPRKNSGGGHSINDASLVSNAATSGTTSSSSKWTSKFVHAEHFADDEKPAARGFRIDGVKQLGQLTRALEQIGQMGKEKEREKEAEAAKVPMPRIAKLSVHLRGAMTERPGQLFLTKNKDDHYELERPKSAGECGQSPTSSDADDDDDEWHPTAHHHSIGKKRRWVDHQRRPLRSNNGELVNVDECQLVMAPAMANELLGELPKCEECDRTFCKSAYFLHMLTSHGTVVEVTKMVLDHLRQLNAAQFAQITWKCQHCHFECHRFEQYAQHCEREEHRNQNQRKKYSHKDVRQIQQEIRGREAEKRRRHDEEKCREEKCQCREGDEDNNYGTGGESGECRPMTKPEVDDEMPTFPIGYFEANGFGKQ